MKYLKIATLIFLFISLILILSFSFQKQKENQITFLNVGQGSGTLIKTKNGTEILIDLSDKQIAQKSLLKELGFFNREIDFLFLTHYDIDHVGGFLDLFGKYKIKGFFTSKTIPENKDQKEVYNLIYKNLKKENIKDFKINTEDILKISENLYIEVLYPFSDLNLNKMNPNETSLVLQIHFTDQSKTEKKVLITGDLSSKMENFLVQKYGKKLKSEILLAGHHGSKTSSSELFLKTVSPKYFVIQAGLSNPYGHPHKSVLNRVLKMNIQILETSKKGNQRFVFKNGNLVLEN
ncbi:hypothetical protein CSB11_00455 [Candidatus Campbellbacteria bacterium]|nr:MAG: hypothetical protein CSB11_00455 [Candidatus Campbellbacteria bacterium]